MHQYEPYPKIIEQFNNLEQHHNLGESPVTETMNPTINLDNGTVTHDKLQAAQAHVDQLKAQLSEAETELANTSRKVSTHQALVQGLQTEIRGGNIQAAAQHSQADATLTALGRDQHNYNAAKQSLQGQLSEAQVVLDLYEALYGHSDLISEQERTTELAEAQAQIRTILEPIIRKYRKSDNALYQLADAYQRYLRTNPTGLQGVTRIGSLDRIDALIFDDGTKLDAMGKHDAVRVAERVLANINADILAEARGDEAPRN